MSNAPSPAGGTVNPPTNWRYIIAMDLGSDSTVVYVEDRSGGNPKAPVPVELQRFHPVLAIEPLLLRDDVGKVSHRLKSRYVATQNCRLPMAPVERLVRARTEILPRTHARTKLVDFEAYYATIQTRNTALNLSNFASSGKNAVVFQLVFDVTDAFPISEILPNAKLVFQTGAMSPKFKVTCPDGETRQIEVGPLEMIKNQVCLILENFVRYSPPLTQGGKTASWSECLLYLTVPNTYSPSQREELGRAVEAELKCQVRTITESDAVVFHYYTTQEPNLGLSDDDLRNVVQQYLTIDIGKGTTDVTLVSMQLKRIASVEERSRRNVDADTTVDHVAVIARTGRASGGALLTYYLAEYLELLVDAAVAEALAPFAQNATGAPLTRSPLRFTRKTPDDVGSLDERRDGLLRFETVCERHKRAIEPVAEGAVETYPFAPITGPMSEIDDLATFIAQAVREIGEARGFFAAPASADQAQEVLKGTIVRALRDPEGFRRSSRNRNGLEGPWRELQGKIQGYVKENVDDVLLDIARSMCNASVVESLERIRMEKGSGVGAAALKAICGSEGRRAHAELPADCSPRTHVVISGQGSQFKPILYYLRGVVGNRMPIVDDKGQPVQIGPRRQAAPTGESPFQRFRRFLMRLAGIRERGALDVRGGDRAVVLTGANLKDACANGALQWHRTNPVLENPNYIHGQFIVKRQGGGEAVCIPMDKLNAAGSAGYRHNMGNRLVPLEVFYVPSRLDAVPVDWKPKGGAEARFDACQALVFRVSRDVNGGGLVDILDDQNRVQRGGGGVYGAADLYPMLWPAQLREEDEE